MVCATYSLSAVPWASGPIFMFCAPTLIFCYTEGVGSRFHVLRSLTHIWRYRGRRVTFSFLRSLIHVRRLRGRRVSFSCFTLSALFWAVPRASDPVVMSYASGLIFVGTDGAGSSYYISRSQTHFRRYRGRHYPCSYFALLDSFLAVSRASCPLFMFCTLGLVLGGTEGVGSRLHILLSGARFWRYRGRRVLFSCFALLNLFWAVPRAPGQVFMFCAHGSVVGDTEGVGPHFHILSPRTRFRRNRGHRFPFWAVSRASCPVIIYCDPGLILDGTEGAGSRFHVLHSCTRLGGTKGVGSRYLVLHSRIRF
jgi:hypothetical protein